MGKKPLDTRAIERIDRLAAARGPMMFGASKHRHVRIEKSVGAQKRKASVRKSRKAMKQFHSRKH